MLDELNPAYANENLLTTRSVYQEMKSGFPISMIVPDIESMQTAFGKLGAKAIPLLEDELRGAEGSYLGGCWTAALEDSMADSLISSSVGYSDLQCLEAEHRTVNSSVGSAQEFLSVMRS